MIQRSKTVFFPAIFTYDPEQEIAVSFPDLGCATSGVDEADAIRSACELLGCVLRGLQEDGMEIPAATPLCDIKTADNEQLVLIIKPPHTRVFRRE